MQFFTEEWYIKYYGNQNIIFCPNIMNEMLDICRRAGTHIEVQLSNAPDDFALKRYSFHDAYVLAMDRADGDIRMQLDSAQCGHSIEHILFRNADFNGDERRFCSMGKLDWFQSEVRIEGGRYHISILFRDWNSILRNDQTGFEYPAPVIMEFSADDAIAIS